MLPEKKTLCLTLVYKGEQYPVCVTRHEYHSLMSLVSDHLGIIGFGLCSGMGSCGTCMVTLRSYHQRQGYKSLSCGIPVNDAVANAIVTITEE